MKMISLVATLLLWVVPLQAQPVALRGATIYAAPDRPPIPNGVVIMRDGRIAAVGPSADVALPPGTQVIDVTGKVLVAGFWNSHVHFVSEKFGGADTLNAAVLARSVNEMLTQWGFTTVFDTGSPLANTLALRRRIESGEVPGPAIFTAGEVIFPVGVRDTKYTVATVEQALNATRELISGGANSIKLYAQTFWDLSLTLPPEVIRAVVQEAHRRGVPVFAHPSNRVGLHNSIANGVDVLVHTTPQIGPWEDSLVAKMKASNVALIPTLQLWRFELQREGAPAQVLEGFMGRGIAQLRQYFQAGGTVLFGTDVGYMTDYSTREEYELMARAGMTFRDILASLTTIPAERHGAAGRAGKILPGLDADIVVLNTDPAASVAAFADVLYVFRKGKQVHQR